MTCFVCHSQNPEDAIFCHSCGSRLAIVCTECGRRNPPGARFCNQCGSRLPATSGDGDAVPARAPAEAVTRVSPPPLSSERRVVTILFCDVKGSTAVAEQLDPEEWAEIMNGAFGPMIRPVYRYDGSVVHLQGDGLLAFFGAPAAHEDDPERAVLAGLAIAQGFDHYAEGVQQRWGIELEVRVGINTGLVVVGEVGSSLRLEYSAMGDAINVAKRMEQAAMPGTVQIAEDTYRLVAPYFEFEDLGAVEVKGKADLVRAYRVLTARQAPIHPRTASRLSTPLVGRDAELGALEAAIRGLLQGRGAVIFLIGEAGLGKSRLIYETAQVWSRLHGPTRWYETGSLSYEVTIPYAQFQRLLRGGAGILPDDPAEIVRSKLKVYVRHFPEPERVEVSKIFETVLAVESGQKRGALGGETFRQRLFDAMLHLSRRWVSTMPMVMVIDDLHWADEASGDLLLHLFQMAREDAVLFLCAMRPDRDTPGWRVRERVRELYPKYYTELWLQPLSPAESNQLLNQITGAYTISDYLRQRILTKTEGNPFFVEEMMMALLQRHSETQPAAFQLGNYRSGQPAPAVQDVEMPDSLQALLLARIDRLEDETRHTLQLAAVVGRTFFYRVLEAIVEDSIDLGRQLEVLQEQELIYESARVPELAYAFRHALTQEAAYNTILLRQRREFHHRVGLALETLLRDRIDEMAPLLAHHFHEAADNQRALQYHIRAGDVAFRLYANAVAVTHYTEAIELARHTPLPADAHTQLFLHRGRTLEVLARHDEALQNYAELEESAHTRGDRAAELEALAAQAALFATPTARHDPDHGRKISERGLALARDLGDVAAEARILWCMLLLSKFDGRWEDAITHGEASLALARKHNLRREMAYALNDLAVYAYFDAGDFRRGQESLQEARRLWEELGDRFMLADNLSAAAIGHYLLGEYEQVVERADQAARISQETGNLWGRSYSSWNLGDVYFEWGEIDRATAVMEHCLALAREAGFVAALVGVGSSLAYLYGFLGQVARGIDLLNTSVQHARERLQFWLPWPLVIQSRLHLREGDADAAAGILEHLEANYGWSSTRMTVQFYLAHVVLARVELALARDAGLQAANSVLDDALTWYSLSGMQPLLSDLFHAKGMVLQRLARPAEASAFLQKAMDAAEAIGSRRALWMAQDAASKLALAQGDQAAAEALRQAAATNAAHIAERISDAELKAAFMTQTRGSTSSRS